MLYEVITQFRYKNFGARGATHIKNFASVFFITLSNPLTILFFGTAITMMGIFDNKFTTLNGLMLVAGVFAGAGLWWFGLSSIVNRFRKKFRLRKLVYLNYISGAIIIGLTLIIGIVITSYSIHYTKLYDLPKKLKKLNAVAVVK